MSIGIVISIALLIPFKTNNKYDDDEYNIANFTDLSEEEFVESLYFQSNNILDMISDLKIDDYSLSLPYNIENLPEKFTFEISETEKV